ncbi:MAG: hypothetical protein V3R68_03880 [Gammaproteobacteria bacterium]
MHVSHLAYLLLFISSTHGLDVSALETQQKAYPIPEHGQMLLDVPRSWEVTYFLPGDNKPPVIIFFPPEKAKRDTFQLTVSFFWDDGLERNVTDPDEIKSLVESVGLKILDSSNEDELILKQIDGASGSGYFFDLSDESAAEGEFKYLTQGAIGASELLIVFSLFRNELDDVLRDATLTMLRNARQRFRPDVNYLLYNNRNRQPATVLKISQPRL